MGTHERQSLRQILETKTVLAFLHGVGKVPWCYNLQNPSKPNINLRIPSSGPLLTYAAKQKILLTFQSCCFVYAGSCGGVLVSPKGQLMSPGYPARYPSNTTCRWVIALPSDYRVISFTFHRVYLEEDRNCVYVASV